MGYVQMEKALEDQHSFTLSKPSHGPTAKGHQGEEMSPHFTPSKEVPWQASPRTVDHPWMSIADWMGRVEKLQTLRHREKTRLIFIGDSITEGWTQTASKVWMDFFQHTFPLSLGIGGDQTQNVLWRIDQGELKGLKPSVAVILIGVNNLWWGGFTPADTAKGVASVTLRVRQELPSTFLIIHPIFPVGRLENDDLRKRIEQTNQLLEENIVLDANMELLNIGQIFLDHKKEIDQAIMHDGVHLTEKGYKLWATALRDRLKTLIAMP